MNGYNNPVLWATRKIHIPLSLLQMRKITANRTRLSNVLDSMATAAANSTEKAVKKRVGFHGEKRVKIKLGKNIYLYSPL